MKCCSLGVGVEWENVNLIRSTLSCYCIFKVRNQYTNTYVFINALSVYDKNIISNCKKVYKMFLWNFTPNQNLSCSRPRTTWPIWVLSASNTGSYTSWGWCSAVGFCRGCDTPANSGGTCFRNDCCQHCEKNVKISSD